MDKYIVQVTTHPFGLGNDEPRRVLERNNWEVRYNPWGRRIKPGEVADVVKDVHGLVADTESYPSQRMNSDDDEESRMTTACYGSL